MIAKEIRAHSAQKLKGISLGYNMRSTAPRRNHKNKSTVCLWILSAFWMTLRAAYGQGNFYEFGICACTPNRYDFRLDFSLKCPTTEELELVLEDGVVTAECAVVPTKPGEKIADLMPASAQSLEITELRQDNSIAVQESIEGDFLDGDAFRYVSFAETLEEIQEANDIPKTLQFTIQGKNRNGEKITNVVVIEFNNDCDSYPVIRSNNTAGWIRFMDSSPPNPELCSAYVPEPTSNESSEIPSESPSIISSAQPSGNDRSPAAVILDHSQVDFSSAKNDILSASPTHLQIKYIGFGSAPPTTTPTEFQTDATGIPGDDEVMSIPCSICASKIQCIQSPQEIYPAVTNPNGDITCREIETFAVFSTVITYGVCNSLQENAVKGFCGGCGTSNCVMTTAGYSIARIQSALDSLESSVPSDAPSLMPTTPLSASVSSSTPTALSVIQNEILSSIPSDIPSSIPTALSEIKKEILSSTPSDAPSLMPSTAPFSSSSLPPSSSPSDILSKSPTTHPSIRFPSVSPSFVTENEGLDPLYKIPSEFDEESDVIVKCNLCPEGCFNSPNELFPYLEEGVEVSCRTVEEFAFITGVKASSCTLLKTYAFWGACGGCGVGNCP